MVEYLKTCSDKSERIETAADSEGGEHGERVEPLLVQHRPFDGRDRNNADTKKSINCGFRYWYNSSDSFL